MLADSNAANRKIEVFRATKNPNPTHREIFQMAKVTFITAQGESIVVDNAAGTLMEIALDNNVAGIEGACGGVCSCATCHIHIDDAWKAKIGPAPEDELDLLDTEDNFCDASRLGCQIEMTDDMDGLVVRVANE